MARRLSVRQKSILKKQVDLGYSECSELPDEIYDQLNDINCYECINSDIDRYMRDLVMAKLNN